MGIKSVLKNKACSHGPELRPKFPVKIFERTVMALNTVRNSVKFNVRAALSFIQSNGARNYSDSASKGRKGLILGVYSDADEREHKFTSASAKFNANSGGKLEELLKEGMHIKKGKGITFQNVDKDFTAVTVVGLGIEDLGFNPLENMDECKETIRVAAAVGARKLKEIGMTQIFCEGFGHTESAAEGANLAIWRYQGQRGGKKSPIVLNLYHDDDKDGWLRGMFKADAQNLARRLSDTPANLMTPALFAQEAVDSLCPCGVNVEIRDKDWLENNKFSAFLAVARGSCEPPAYLELQYCGGSQDQRPIVLIGKGITFDAGGLNLKKCKRMSEYRGDMTGAAVVVAVMRAVAALSLPINLTGAIPLCENMPSGMAMRPGDVVAALNGKNILIEDTDNEGRLCLADVLVYSQRKYKPRLIIDVGSLTGGIRSALGSAATGVFTNNHDLWSQVQKAGAITGDRMWRLPLWHHYKKKVTGISTADVTNVGSGGGAPCRAAAFLKEFVPCGDWLHMDTTGTGLLANAIDYPYLSVGRMMGRPTRTLIQLLYQLACPKAIADAPCA